MKGNSNTLIIENKVIKGINSSESMVTIPSDVIRIGKGAFKGSNLSSVVFEGNNLKSIDDDAFRDCTRLTNIMIPEGVVQIGDNAFFGCSQLDYIGIPESVMVVGDNILDNCKSGLFVIGKEKSEAANIADHYKLTLKSDSAHAISAFEQANTAKAKIETKVFDIFGENISCSNTLSKYHNNLEYYSSRKEPVFNEFAKKLPKTINENFGDLLSTLQKEQSTVLSRLSSQGVFVNTDALNIYLLEPYNAILEAVKAIKQVYDTVAQDVANGINNNREALISEAESKVTGLSYGIIGDGLDMIAYSIDDYRERKRQRQEAYAAAEKKAAQFRQQHTNQGNRIYSDFVSKALPYLHQGTDMFVDALCKAENDHLVKAGLIDATIETSIDITKSSQLMNSIADKQGDNTFTVALALKKYPCNIAALVYAKEHGYKCQGLTDLVNFLGFERKLESGIKESKEKRVLEKTNSLQAMTNGNAGVSLIKRDADLLDESEIKQLLNTLAASISPSIEKILMPEKFDSITNAQTYCSNELNRIISPAAWSYFQQHAVLPVKSSVIKNTNDYSELKNWLCEQLELKIKKTEQEYSDAKERFSSAKSISDLEKTEPLFNKLGDYRDSVSISQTIKNTIAEKKRKKTKTTVISVLSAIVVIVIAICSVVSYVNNIPYRELKEAVSSGTFSSEWRSSKGSKVVSNWDQKALQIVADKLSEYHSNDDAKSALSLLTELMELDIQIDGKYFYASSSFIDWIKDSAISNGSHGSIVSLPQYRKEEEMQYNIYGYQLTWSPDMMMNQFYLYVPSENDSFIVMVNNSFYKIPSSEKVGIN